jgi:aminoglycoside phosphotransferase (APT) family kinase protein
MRAPGTDVRLEQVVHGLAPQGKLLRAWPLEGGISAGMTALEITGAPPRGQVKRMVLRRPSEGALRHNPHAAEDEFRLLRVTQSLGLATPKPYHLDQSGEILPTPYLVIEYVEGEMAFAPTDLACYVRQLAEHLARIHSADLSSVDLSFLPRQAGGCAEMQGRRPAEADQALEEGCIRETLASLWPLPWRNAPALLHGDFWPGNVLWREGKLVAVIDWEDAKLGDPLADLGISRLDIAWILGSDAMRAFTRRYQSLVDIDYTSLPYWDLCAALRLIRLAGGHFAEWAAFFAPYGRDDITEQTMSADYRSFVAQAFAELASQ